MNSIPAQFDYEITSPQNDKFKFLCRLTEAKELKHEDYFLLSGRKLIQEFLALKKLGTSKTEWNLHAEITSNLTDSARQSQAPLWFLDKKLFSQVDVIRTNFNLLVVKKPKLSEFDPDSPARGMEVILPLGDPGNLGAVLRSCEAFGASRIILTTEAAQVFLPKAVKSASGSLFRLELLKGPSLKNFSAVKGPLISLDSEGQDLKKFNWPKDFRLIVGEEGPGLPKELQSQKIKIATRGVESLNATVAASIAMFHYQSGQG